MQNTTNQPGFSPELPSTANPAGQVATPEFCTVQDARPLFGLARSSIYEHAAAGRIRLVRIRKPGHLKGRVLVDCASVRRFLNECANE